VYGPVRLDGAGLIPVGTGTVDDRGVISSVAVEFSVETEAEDFLD
jgi:hypothetical protein